MKDKINSILSEAKNKIAEAANEGELQSVKSAYIGKQGSLSLLMKEMRNWIRRSGRRWVSL